MEELMRVDEGHGVDIYRLSGEHEGAVQRYLFSTAETSEVLQKPEIFGVEYTERLERGLELFFKAFQNYRTIADSNACVLHFLRGGLNFGVREALHKAYGWNRQSSTFISSQRDRDENGRWYIREDSYRKSTIKKGSVIFCADVVATGVTLEQGLKTLTEIVVADRGSIRRLVFITIGCHKAEKILSRLHDEWKQTFPDFEGIDLVYIEGKFRLADSDVPLSIKLPGTDLLIRDALIAPAFKKRLDASLPAALERCIIYDAGSRAFDVEKHVEDVREYWQQVLELAARMDTMTYLAERFPEASPELKAEAEAIDLATLAKQRIELFSN